MPGSSGKNGGLFGKAKKAYNTIAVVPNIECCNLETEKLEADHVVKRCDVKPFGEYVVIFVSASQNLIVKTALCLSDCFESKIVIDAIESGQSVYMYKEEKTCSSAPPAYRRRLSEYEREVSCYGVSFNELPKECSTNFISTRSEAAAGKKRNIITAEDVVKMRQGDKLFVYRGDIVTEVAAEVAQERDIEIVYC